MSEQGPAPSLGPETPIPRPGRKPPLCSAPLPRAGWPSQHLLGWGPAAEIHCPPALAGSTAFPCSRPTCPPHSGQPSLGLVPAPKHTQARLCPGKHPPPRACTRGLRGPGAAQAGPRATGHTQAQDVGTSGPGAPGASGDSGAQPHRHLPPQGENWSACAPTSLALGVAAALSWALRRRQTGLCGAESRGWSRRPSLLAPPPGGAALAPHLSASVSPSARQGCGLCSPRLLPQGPRKELLQGPVEGGGESVSRPAPAPPLPPPPPLLPLPKRSPGRAPA